MGEKDVTFDDLILDQVFRQMPEVRTQHETIRLKIL